MTIRSASPGFLQRPLTGEAVRRTGPATRLLVAGPVLTWCCLGLPADAVGSETVETVAAPNTPALETMRRCAMTHSLRMRVGHDPAPVNRFDGCLV